MNLKIIAIPMALLVGRAAFSQPKQPNILVITYDDLRPQIHSYGLPDPITPNIDQLAGEGTRFNSAYTSYPLVSAFAFLYAYGNPFRQQERYKNSSFYNPMNSLAITDMNKFFRNFWDGEKFMCKREIY